jgi:hypothetical protein
MACGVPATDILSESDAKNTLKTAVSRIGLLIHN